MHIPDYVASRLILGHHGAASARYRSAIGVSFVYLQIDLLECWHSSRPLSTMSHTVDAWHLLGHLVAPLRLFKLIIGDGIARKRSDWAG